MSEGSGIWTPPGGSADPRQPEQPQHPPPGAEPTPEEILEQLRRLKVADVLVSTVATVAQLGFAKLEPASRDLEQAKLAIESLRALVPLLEESLPAEASRELAQVVAQLQLAYVAAADAPAESAEATEPAAPADGV